MISSERELPLYEQAKQWLREQISKGLLVPDHKLPSETELAHDVGVSPMTMRRAMIELTREGLFKRVRGKGTFVRESFAPKRRIHRVGVGLLVPFNPSNPGGPFFQRLVHALQVASEDSGIFLTLRHVKEPYEAFVQSLNSDKSLKALIALDLDDQKLLHLLQGSSKPVILLDNVQPDSGPQFDEVNCLGEQGMLHAVNALLQFGHREIALIQCPVANEIMSQRQSGYEKALQAFDITAREDLIYRAAVCHEGGYRCMSAIIASGRVPTAIVCVSDEMAVGVMVAALENGMKLPRDLSVVGFGDLGEFTVPVLSTVKIPLDLMARAALKVLWDRLKKPTAPLKRELFEAEWTPRNSCTTPRQALSNC
jgi:DNA-binding LacI/PurR family transcriptional regulator